MDGRIDHHTAERSAYHGALRHSFRQRSYGTRHEQVTMQQPTLVPRIAQLYYGKISVARDGETPCIAQGIH